MINNSKQVLFGYALINEYCISNSAAKVISLHFMRAGVGLQMVRFPTKNISIIN